MHRPLWQYLCLRETSTKWETYDRLLRIELQLPSPPMGDPMSPFPSLSPQKVLASQTFETPIRPSAPPRILLPHRIATLQLPALSFPTVRRSSHQCCRCRLFEYPASRKAALRGNRTELSPGDRKARQSRCRPLEATSESLKREACNLDISCPRRRQLTFVQAELVGLHCTEILLRH